MIKLETVEDIKAYLLSAKGKQLSDRQICRKLQHTLVKYMGGGYDGCFEEPNFCSIGEVLTVDPDEEEDLEEDVDFSSLYNSGIYGIKTITKLLSRMKYRESSDYFHIFKIPIHGSRKQKHKAVKEIMEEISPRYHSFITGFLSEGEKDDDLVFPCGVCGKREYAEKYISAIDLGWGRGCGGLAITTDQYAVCEDCVTDHSCEYCGSFHGYSTEPAGSEPVDWGREDEETGQKYCIDCWEKKEGETDE